MSLLSKKSSTKHPLKGYQILSNRIKMRNGSGRLFPEREEKGESRWLLQEEKVEEGRRALRRGRKQIRIVRNGKFSF